MADVKILNGYNIKDALALRNKATADATSFVDTSAGTASYPTTGELLTNSIIIGNGANAKNTIQKSNIVIIGKDAATNNSASTIIGSSSNGSGVGVTTLGYGSYAFSDYAVSLGYTSYASAQYSVSLGYNCHAYANSSIAIGRSAYVGTSSNQSIAIGNNSKINDSKSSCVALGYGAQCNASNSIQLGYGTNNNPSSLQFLSYPLVDNEGYIYDERIREYIRFTTEYPFVLEETKLGTTGDDSYHYALLYTGQDNNAFTHNLCYKSKADYSHPSAYCVYVDGEYLQKRSQIIIDQKKFFAKLAEITQQRIDDDDDYNNGVVGGTVNEYQYMTFNYNGTDEEWYITFDYGNFESFGNTTPQNITGITNLEDFGIYLPYGFELPDSGEYNLFDIQYCPPIEAVEYAAMGYVEGYASIDYITLMDAMCSNTTGFGVVVSNMQTWDYEVDGTTHHIPILPESYYRTGNGIQLTLTWDGVSEWAVKVGSITVSSLHTEDLVNIGIHIQPGDEGEIGEFYVYFKPARQLSWEQFNPIDESIIPTVNNSTITVTQNGLSVGSFTLNQANGDTIALTDTTYSVMTGASAGDAGTSGLVPAPAAGDQAKFLQGDGTWANPTAATAWGNITGTLGDQTDLQNALNAKANVDMDNLTSTGKEVCANMAMPSDSYIELTLGSSGSTYTAPADGYVFVDKSSTAAGQYLQINFHNMVVSQLAVGSGNRLRVYALVTKGTYFGVSYNAGGTTNVFRFVYANGAK